MTDPLDTKPAQDTAADLQKELAHIVRWYGGDIVYIIRRVRELETEYARLREAALRVIEIDRLIGGADMTEARTLRLLPKDTEAVVALLRGFGVDTGGRE